MATLAQIIKQGHGKAGSGGAWRVEHKPEMYYSQGTECYALYHYSTEMLVWADHGNGVVSLIDFSTGHGSVSDQNGMNTAFRTLGLDLYYSRRNGAAVN